MKKLRTYEEFDTDHIVDFRKIQKEQDKKTKPVKRRGKAHQERDDKYDRIQNELDKPYTPWHYNFYGDDVKSNESIDYDKVDKAIEELRDIRDIENWVEGFLDSSDDWDEAQMDLVSYVTDEIDDDNLRIMWTDVIQSF